MNGLRRFVFSVLSICVYLLLTVPSWAVPSFARQTGMTCAACQSFVQKTLQQQAGVDNATVNLPFSRAACAVGEPVAVPPDADDRLLELKRQKVEVELNSATERAHAIVDRRAG